MDAATGQRVSADRERVQRGGRWGVFCNAGKAQDGYKIQFQWRIYVLFMNPAVKMVRLMSDPHGPVRASHGVREVGAKHTHMWAPTRCRL